jgi:hypothetical protein
MRAPEVQRGLQLAGFSHPPKNDLPALALLIP